MKNKDLFLEKGVLFKKQHDRYVKNSLKILMQLHEDQVLRFKRSLVKKLQILSLHQKGLSYSEIAKELKVSKQYLYKSVGAPIFRKRAPKTS